MSPHTLCWTYWPPWGPNSLHISTRARVGSVITADARNPSSRRYFSFLRRWNFSPLLLAIFIFSLESPSTFFVLCVWVRVGVNNIQYFCSKIQFTGVTYMRISKTSDIPLPWTKKERKKKKTLQDKNNLREKTQREKLFPPHSVLSPQNPPIKSPILGLLEGRLQV